MNARDLRYEPTSVALGLLAIAQSMDRATEAFKLFIDGLDRELKKNEPKL